RKQVIWTGDAAFLPTNIVPPASIALKSFLTMDSWLSTIESDTRDVPLLQKVLNDKPQTAAGESFIGAALSETTDPATCAAAFPHFGDARLAAGEPLVDNAMACQLKPLDPAHYSA